MPSAYTAFDATKPASSQTGSAFATSANANDIAEWYGSVEGGSMPGWVYAPVTGTGTAEQPQYFVWTNGTQRVRSTNTWGVAGGGTGNLTQQVWEVSQDSGSTPNSTGTWAAVATQTFTYDASGNLTATTGAGGSLDQAKYLLGKVKTLLTAFNAHIAATGTAVHGLANMATQSNTAVNIDGGNIDATAIGATTPAAGTFTQARELKVAPVFGATTTCDWAAAAAFAFTATSTGAATLAFSNLPAAGVAAIIYVVITNGGVRTWTYPAGTKWPSGTAPTLSSAGTDALAFMTFDGGTTYYAFLSGKGMA